VDLDELFHEYLLEFY